MAAKIRPCLVIVGGVNGSGKTTFAERAAGTDLFLGQTAVNPDNFTSEAKGAHRDLNQVGADLVGVERAEKAVWRAIAEGRSVFVETVLSSDKFVAAVRAAQYRRYRTRLIFVALPTVDLALQRIEVRVNAGGHNVPEQKVRERWKKAHDNLTVFLPLVDDVLIFSNESETDPVLVAERVGRHRAVRLYNREALPEVARRLTR